MLPGTKGLIRSYAGPWKYPPPRPAPASQMGPSLSLTVLYLKGHCRLASLPCSEQYTFAIEEAGEEGKGGREAGRARHRLLFRDA